MAAGVKLYAISYDDREALAEFREKQAIPYALLSDVDSATIRRYGILNDRIRPGDALLHGIPYPGVFVCDEDGVVISKFFHDTYKKRDSPERLLDAALGRVVLDGTGPRAEGGDDGVRVTAAVRGGSGSLRQGIIRELVVRFELAAGLHVYGEPVPEGMVPVQVDVRGPPGLVVQAPVVPPTTRHHLPEMDLTLPVWSGTVDVRVPFYPVGELASETRPLDRESATLSVTVRYQACDERTCLVPRTEDFTLELPLDVVDVPRLSIHMGHGQREGRYDAFPHARRLLRRKTREAPLGFLRFLVKQARLTRAARKRARIAPTGGSSSAG